MEIIFSKYDLLKNEYKKSVDILSVLNQNDEELLKQLDLLNNGNFKELDKLLEKFDPNLSLKDYNIE